MKKEAIKVIKAEGRTKIELDFQAMFDGDLDKYHRWSVEGAARRICESPNEYELTLMAYKIHRTILKNKGYDPKKLEEGDNRLVKLVKEKIGAMLS